MEAAKSNLPTGCYKCGQQGHWSRDCPQKDVPTDPINGEDPTEGNKEARALEGEQVKEEEPKLVKRNPRSKLTVDMLKTNDGIPLVYNAFPDLFRVQFKGKGHEVGDLGRFLTMYRKWQQKFLGSTTYEEFLLKLEKVGATYQMKKELRELRHEAWRLIEEENRPGGWRMADSGDDRSEGAAAGHEDKEICNAVDNVDDFGWEDSLGPEEDAEVPQDLLCDAYHDGEEEKQTVPSPHSPDGTTKQEDVRLETVLAYRDSNENKMNAEEGGLSLASTEAKSNIKEDLRPAEDSVQEENNGRQTPLEQGLTDALVHETTEKEDQAGMLDDDILEDDLDEAGVDWTNEPMPKRTRLLLDDDEEE